MYLPDQVHFEPVQKRTVLGLDWRYEVTNHEGDPFQPFLPEEEGGPATDSTRGVVVVGSRLGYITCLDAINGRLMWRTRVKGRVVSKPLIDKRRVFFGTSSGNLVAVDLDSGERLWKYSANGEIMAQPIVNGDTLIFATNANTVYALNKRTGRWKWHYKKERNKEMSIRGLSRPTIIGKQVVTGFSDGTLVSLDLADGSLLWSRDLSSKQTHFIDINTTPVLEDSMIFVSSFAGGLFCVKAKDGSIVWSDSTLTGISGIVRIQGLLWAVSFENGIEAFKVRDGSRVFSYKPEIWSMPNKPIIADNLLIVSTFEGPVFVFDAFCGKLIQTFATGYGFASSPEVGFSRVYVLSNGGFLYAFKLGREGYLDVGTGTRNKGRKLFGPEILEQTAYYEQ
ncbi:MAG: PQQ-binding-like beta-propeller repeat protein [Deltaproteobacteria bacterium]|nr:PQQ-binding-like beta-propeller repeat protein [Deltaproteobacteria bacterium]